MDVISLCSELVKIRSENPPGYTDEVISFLQDICTSIGIQTQVACRERRWNLLSKNPSGKLLICGHVDVVPALDEGWTYPPFSGRIDTSFVHGRGSTDMKGGCAALLSALHATIEEGFNPPVDIAFVADEEGKGQFGLEQLIKENILHPKTCLIAEPTPVYTPLIGEKGVLRSHITFRGDAGHASLHPVKGNSAILQACAFLSFCQKIHERVWPSDDNITSAIETTADVLSTEMQISHEDATRILTRVMFNPGIIDGGERVNVVAQKCTLEMDMRIPWGCHIKKLIREMRETFPDTDILVGESADPSFSSPGWLCELLCLGIEKVHAITPKPGVTQAATDARYLRSLGALSAVSYTHLRRRRCQCDFW